MDDYIVEVMEDLIREGDLGTAAGLLFSHYIEKKLFSDEKPDETIMMIVHELSMKDIPNKERELQTVCLTYRMFLGVEAETSEIKITFH